MKYLQKIYLIMSILLLFVIVGCNSAVPDSTNAVEEGEVEEGAVEREIPLGLSDSQTDMVDQEVYPRLLNALKSAEPIGIVAEIDHSSNAANAGLTLPETAVVLFGNPMLGTPLMQQNQLTGLDLPQKMLVYSDDEHTYVAYNSTQYLAQRHGVGSVETLPKIEQALENFATGASGGEVDPISAESISRDEGIIIVDSNLAFDMTLNNLKNALNQNPNITIIAELDHQANAASVGMELRPTHLIVFGNPKLGTPLMEAQRTVAIDLPQKMLVYEDGDGNVHIAYNDPAYIATRHRLAGQDETLHTISEALQMLANTAIEAE